MMLVVLCPWSVSPHLCVQIAKSVNISSVCSDLTRMVRAEVDCEDVVTKACDIIQLSEVALQRAAGESSFVKWSHKTKHKGVQTCWPTNRNKCSQE